jgi:hypothetical protein
MLFRMAISLSTLQVNMGYYFKYIILQMILGWFSNARGQDFCESNFGRNWVTFFSYPLKMEKYLDRDTLKFTKIRFEGVNHNHQYLDLNCLDSTFSIVYVSSDTSNDGTIDSWAGYSTTGDGKWKLDTFQHLITFELDLFDTSYTFEYVFISHTRAREKVLMTSEGDCRTQILLIRKDLYKRE